MSKSPVDESHDALAELVSIASELDTFTRRLKIELARLQATIDERKKDD
jgi:hypothetical protein